MKTILEQFILILSVCNTINNTHAGVNLLEIAKLD